MAIALRMVGESLTQSRRIDEARARLEEGCRIMMAVVARDPTNGWAVDGLASLLRLHGEALRLSSDAAVRARACAAFKEARQHYVALESRDALPPASAEDYKAAQSRVAACETNRADR